MNHTTIIGLEVHVQLLTKTKLFCGCVNRFNPDHPNVQTCPVCLGLPGALPVLNEEAFRLALKTGVALNCDISQFTKWDRKQYYYPDLPKAYQISQYDLPFSHDGFLELEVDSETSETRRIGIIRAHLEEDAGKNIHDETGGHGDSRVDLNRCGTPLVEIVTEPDIRSPAEAKRFLEELKLLLSYLGVSDCNMQEGSLRCDANVNLHIHTDDGHKLPTPIVEIKNLNSFRSVELALEFEVDRQLAEWQKTGHSIEDVSKSTRGWDAQRNVTFPQRGKEEASDYRYFPDPDLVPVTVDEERIEEIRASTGEFPADRRNRFRSAFELSAYDAAVIVDQGPAFADYFEIIAMECGDGKQAANWVTQDVLREMHARHQTIAEFALSSEVLAKLLSKIVSREITVAGAREVFQVLMDDADMGSHVESERVDRIIEERNLAVVSDTSQLEGIVSEVIERNPKAAADLRAGKQAAAGPLIGQVMREIRGADAQLVRTMILERVNS